MHGNCQIHVSVCDLTHMFKIHWQRPLRKFLRTENPLQNEKSKPQKLYFSTQKENKFTKKNTMGRCCRDTTGAHFHQGVWLQILHERLPETAAEKTHPIHLMPDTHTHTGDNENRNAGNQAQRESERNPTKNE